MLLSLCKSETTSTTAATDKGGGICTTTTTTTTAGVDICTTTTTAATAGRWNTTTTSTSTACGGITTPTASYPPNGYGNYKDHTKRKGNKARKATQFQKGRTPTTAPKMKSDPVVRPTQRFDKYEHSFIVKQTEATDVEFSMPGGDGEEGYAISLRPYNVEEEEEYGEADEIIDSPDDPYYEIVEGNILVEKSRLCQLFNTALEEHSRTECTSFNFDLVRFKPWGHFCQAQAACTNCTYRSSHVNLYEELISNRRGRRPATGNVRLQVLLQDISVGNTAVQLILAALGLRPGSLSSMQNLAYRASDASVLANTENMQLWRVFIKEVQEKRGVVNPNHISGGFDVRYHGVFKKSAVTPGLGAIQAAATLVETVTDHKKVIAIDIVNKCCPKGTRLIQDGCADPACGTEMAHEGCTATQPPYKPIGEGAMAERIAEDIGESADLAVVDLVSDSDGKGINGFRAENSRSGETLPHTDWKKDLVHVSANQRNKILHQKFSRGAFGVKINGDTWNTQEFKDCQKAFAHDLPYRCALVLRRVLKYYSYNMTKVKKSCPSVIQYMIRCYNGDHSKCDHTRLGRKLLFCSKSSRWFTSSPHLAAQRITSLKMTDNDISKVCTVIGMKLGEESVDYYARLSTTSKNEAVNRAIKHSLPTNVTYARCGVGRAHSAVLKCNNGLLVSTTMKLNKLNCSLPQVTKEVLQNYVKKQVNAKRYKESSKGRRQFLNKVRLEEYYQKTRKEYTNNDEYRKNQLDEEIKKLNTAVLLNIEMHNGNVESVDLSDVEASLSGCLQQTRSLQNLLVENEEAQAVKRRKRRATKQKKSKAAACRVKRKKEESMSRDARLSEHSYGAMQLSE